MTLRFFRRTPGATKKTAKEVTDTKSDEREVEEKPSPRRRSRSRSSGRAKSGEQAVAEEKAPAKAVAEKKTAPAKSEGTAGTQAAARPSGGRRRGRRGGSSRKAAAKTAAETADARADAVSVSAKAEAPTLEGLMSQQQATLQELAAQQVSTLKGLQGSLAAIEGRLAGADGPASPTERPRVGIFVDVPNIMYAAERERVKIDFGKVLEFLTGNRELVRASAYAPISDDPAETLETQKFVQPFVDLGYRIVTKPLKRYANGTIKANFDVELAIDVLTMSDRLDIVVLLSGDGDFRRLVELVESKGVRVEVVAFGQSTAAELRAVADKYVDIGDHLKELRVK